MTNIVLIGSLDTKGNEYAYVAERIHDAGANVLTIDVGILGEPNGEPTIVREHVAKAAGSDINELIEANDRGSAISVMARGAAKIALRLYEEGKLDGVLGLGGSGGTSLVTHAMQALPIGVPKLMVSTVASGDTRPYIGATDITMMYSVVDIAGMNRISSRILSNAAAAIVGMATAYRLPLSHTTDKPIIGATMFGVTTECVTEARRLLEEQGYEVLVFHATGVGGQAMESLAQNGFLAGVLDVTTTELADDLVGGVLSAGPTRLEKAGDVGIPQVVSLGALDMVNFGSYDSVPTKFKDRNLYAHNPTVTLMRTTPEECTQLGKIIGKKLSASKGPTSLFVPRGGISAISVPGEVFYDPAADTALFDSLLNSLDNNIQVYDMPLAVNDPQFAHAMVKKLVAMLGL